MNEKLIHSYVLLQSILSKYIVNFSFTLFNDDAKLESFLTDQEMESYIHAKISEE